MRVILLAMISVFSISCGKAKMEDSVWSSSKPQALREVSMSGIHTGEKWEGKLALMHESELFDEPALSFDIVTDFPENPCGTLGIEDRSVLITIKKDPKATNDRYINFSDFNSNRYLSSPSFEYKFKKTENVITEIGILFDIDDKNYAIEGYVPVVDCRFIN